MYVCVCVCIWVYMYVCMHRICKDVVESMYVCMCVCMYELHFPLCRLL